MSRLNLKAETPTEERLLKYLETNASDSLVERINAGKKTMHGAWAFITDWAQKEFKPTAQNPNAGCEDAEVFNRLIHYFEEDSIDFEKKAPVANAKVVGGQPYTPSVRPKKGRGKTKVAVQSAESLDLDSMLAECGIEVAGEEKKPEPEPEPEPEVPPASEERKEPVQTDWLTEFGISV